MSFNFDSTDRQSLTASVYQYIRTGIIEGRYKTGDFLVETKLADELGVSRTPIREALKQIELDDLAHSIPNRGVVVHALSKQDIDDIFAIRLLLEGQAAYWAAERINEEQLEKLSEIVELLELYTRRNDVAQLAKLDSDFHDVIYTAAASRTLKHILTTLHQNLQNARRSSLTKPNRPPQSLNEHRQILDAIQRKQPDDAKSYMESHILHAGHTD